jgi:RNA polymerase II subunit A small phosphatase-like protein
VEAAGEALAVSADAPGRPLLILDLDETLLYAEEIPLERPPDFEVGPYAVYRRPHLAAFLRQVARHYEIAVWTSSNAAYAREICAQVFSASPLPAFVWARDRCTHRRDLENDSWTHAKHLSKLKRRGYDLRRVLVVDDSPEKHRRNYGNLVRVRPYFGDTGDDELVRLGAYLESIADIADYRRLEKRFWRTRSATLSGEDGGAGRDA